MGCLLPYHVLLGGWAVGEGARDQAQAHGLRISFSLCSSQACHRPKPQGFNYCTSAISSPLTKSISLMTISHPGLDSKYLPFQVIVSALSVPILVWTPMHLLQLSWSSWKDGMKFIRASSLSSSSPPISPPPHLLVLLHFLLFSFNFHDLIKSLSPQDHTWHTHIFTISLWGLERD